MIKEIEKNKAKFIQNVKEKAKSGNIKELNREARESLSAETAFAAAYLAIKEGLGLTPFDTQLTAGAYLDDDAIVELATGEGKTVAAVFAAYWSNIKGEHVNIFTFNDYLAKRDCLWMKPAYDLLGVSVSYITEDTPKEKRKELYAADVVYSTAKECGFDYLRDFSAYSADETVSGKFEKVIVDEADSILIDEARIPLIIAGSFEIKLDEDFPRIFDFVKSLSEEEYEVGLDTQTAYLTVKGQKRTEEFFGVDNIYDEENNQLLAKIGDCLEALYVYGEDVDYIVKEDRISVIDKFTGRVAEDRHFPGLVQAAAELKHGLKVTERGAVIGEITIQYFIRLFSRISGMTGTASDSREEFDSFYGLIVKRVEPNKPSQRVDLPMAVYYDRKAKFNAAAEEVLAAYEKGQPVLVGMADIEQSEEFSEILKAKNIPHTVLNAKNDELEAGIIKNAGSPSVVTVSTTMTGRGVDIKLGGEDEKYHDEVAEKGGLYVICTFMAESARINNQLYGRAARQGDPGQSRLFVSLDEDIMEINRLRKHIPESRYPEPTAEEIKDKLVIKEVGRVQKVSQDKRCDERVRLMKFGTINENHRKLIFSSRKKVIDKESKSIWAEYFSEDYKTAVKKYGEEAVKSFEREANAAVINKLWSSYLEDTASLREGIHLRAIGGRSPEEEYNIECETSFTELESAVIDEMGEILSEMLEKGIENSVLPKPKKVWTYLLADVADELRRRTLAEAIFGDDEDYDEGYSDDYDEIYGEEAEDIGEEEPEPQKEEKKGFFARLFGKKS